MNTIFILTLQESASTQAGAGWTQWGFLILLFLIFWLFMIRPQMKKQKELKKYRDALKKGDKIMTTGGIFGKIIEIGNDNTVIIEVESQARLRVSKEALIKDMSDAPQTK